MLCLVLRAISLEPGESTRRSFALCPGTTVVARPGRSSSALSDLGSGVGANSPRAA
jgi:hypothetical protein